MDMSRYEKIPVEEATKPKDRATILANRYWCIVDECVMFYDGMAPQCNSNKELAQMVCDRLFASAEIRFLPAVYVKN